MELSENDLKNLENLLVKDNVGTKNSNKNKKIKNINDFRKNRIINSISKLQKKSKKAEVKFKFPKISLNIPTNENKINNEKLEISLNNSQSENDNHNNKKKDSPKKEHSLIVKNMLEQIRRKTDENSPKSSNTNLKLYGELFPGPGYYDLNKNDIGISHNLRYKNLFISESKKKKKFSEINIGPGKYNLVENFNHVSYAQKNIGPGSYEISSLFGKNYNKGVLSNSIKLENKKEKIQKLLKEELNLINNTNFFNLNFKNNKKIENFKNDFSKNKINKNYFINEKIIGNDDLEFKNRRFNSIQNSKRDLNKKYLIDKNKSKRKCITNENLEYNEKLFPSIKRKFISLI